MSIKLLPDLDTQKRIADATEEIANKLGIEKVNTSDIVDNLNSTDTDKPLSANQGKVLNDTKADKTYVDARDQRLDDRIDNIIVGTIEGASAQEIIDARQGEVTLGENITKVKSQLAHTMLTPEMFGAVGDGVTDDSKAINEALKNASGNVLKFDQNKIYAYSGKIISDGLKSATIDFNQSTLKDLGSNLTYKNGQIGRNPVGVQFKNFDELTIKGLVHDTVHMDWGILANDKAHLKNASVEFREGENLTLGPIVFKGLQGAIPEDGYPYWMSLDYAINFGHLKVFDVKNIELKGFAIEKGGGAECIQFGECTNIHVKNGNKTDVTEFMSFAKFIKCDNLTFEQMKFDSEKSTSFTDVSGDNILVKDIVLNYPNGKLLDVTSEWGEVGGELGRVTVDNVKAITSIAVFCSRMAMPFAPPSTPEFKAVADQVIIKNSVLGDAVPNDATEQNRTTLLGATDRFKDIVVKDTELYNFFYLTGARPDNTYVGGYTRLFDNIRYTSTKKESTRFNSIGKNRIINSYFNTNYQALKIVDNYSVYVTQDGSITETEFEFKNTTFEDVFIDLEANIVFKDCTFINCTFKNFAISPKQTTQTFNNCSFKWTDSYSEVVNEPNPFRLLATKQLNFYDCTFKGNPKYTLYYFFETDSVLYDYEINISGCLFDINKKVGEGGFAFKLSRTTVNNVEIKINLLNTQFSGRMAIGRVEDTVSSHTKPFKLKMENTTSTQTEYAYSIEYYSGGGNALDKLEFVLIKNVLSNTGTQLLKFDPTALGKYINIDNHVLNVQ